MLKRKKYTPRPERPKDWRVKAREHMAEALAAYKGPITKCEPGSARDRALSASNRVANRSIAMKDSHKLCAFVAQSRRCRMRTRSFPR
jgi:hypothetical protein